MVGGLPASPADHPTPVSHPVGFMARERILANTTLDPKGRIALPAALRHKLQSDGVDTLVLTFFDGAIRAYPVAWFEEHIEGPIAARDPFDPQTQVLHHAVLAGAEDMPVDAQGRLRIPKRLQEEAGLTSDVVVFSMLYWIEIWDARAWQDRRADALRQRARAHRSAAGDP